MLWQVKLPVAPLGFLKAALISPCFFLSASIHMILMILLSALSFLHSSPPDVPDVDMELSSQGLSALSCRYTHCPLPPPASRRQDVQRLGLYRFKYIALLVSLNPHIQVLALLPHCYLRREGEIIALEFTIFPFLGCHELMQLIAPLVET